MKLRSKEIPFNSTSNPGNTIQWRSAISGPFLIARCTEVLPGFCSIIDEETDLPIQKEFGAKFTKNSNISLVLSGSFEFVINSHPTLVTYNAGEMMPEIRYKESHTMRALDKSNGFVCLTPLKKTFWNRNLYCVTKGISTELITENSEDQYLFIASGYCKDNGDELYSTNAVYKANSDTQYIFNSDTTCYIIHVWK